MTFWRLIETSRSWEKIPEGAAGNRKNVISVRKKQTAGNRKIGLVVNEEKKNISKVTKDAIF